MGPKKRIKNSVHDSVEVKSIPKSKYLKKSSDTKDNSSSNRLELYLSILPNEVLLRIYQYLSPLDLLSLSSLSQRFNELTSCIKEADFSLCQTACPEQISSYFSRLRVHYIKKLNCNYNIFLRPSILEHLICRCKNLTELSVIECGIKLNHLLKIFQSCPKLENLSWSVYINIELDDNTYYSNIKTLNLFLCSAMLIDDSVKKFMLKFPNVKYFYLTIGCNTFCAFPFHSFYKLHSNSLTSEKYTIITNLCHDKVYTFCKDPEIDYNAFRPPSENKMYDCPPYLQMESTEKDISLLSSDCCKVYSSVTIILTEEIVYVSESLMSNIRIIAGDKLNYLSFQCEASINKEDIVAVCDIIRDISLCCQNITVLNIPTVHFTIYSPFKAITQLKNLKTLNIASCAFRRPCHENQEICEFYEVVSKCRKVENFTLIGCSDDFRVMLDADMYPLQYWKNLKHLTIYNMIFRSCNFLNHVATSCEKLKSLSLISDDKGSLFAKNIIYVLRFAKNLSFIRINIHDFYPMYEGFWDSIGAAANLEGICIVTRSKAYVSKSIVMKAINQLKYLHLFHFDQASDSLYKDVRRLMQNHGVKNIEVHKYCFDFCDPALYHQKPIFACRLFHFEI